MYISLSWADIEKETKDRYAWVHCSPASSISFDVTVLSDTFSMNVPIVIYWYKSIGPLIKLKLSDRAYSICCSSILSCKI